jgi:hypothetical protein
MPDSPLLPSKLPAAHAKRLAWALKAHGHFLSAAVRIDTSPEARQVEKLCEEQLPEHVGRIILERADPTMAKTMTEWLVKQYAQGGLRLEDTGTAHETLEMFQRYAPKLPEDQRDLGRYQSFAEAWQVVFPLAEAERDKLSGKAQKAMERDKAYAESRILRQDPDGFTVAVPLTEFAAKWWGRGTSWCTAAEKDNQFGRYYEEAPLIVIVIPELKEKGKFQLWTSVHDVECMNAADEPVTKDFFDAYWPRFEGAMRCLAIRADHALMNVPEVRLTEEFCKHAIRRLGSALEHVPQALRTEEICQIAVAQYGTALCYVPDNQRSIDLCRVAVEQTGWALRDVPRAFRSEDLCKIAVQQCGSVLSEVPLELRTEEICMIAVHQEGSALRSVPQALRTEGMCKIAVAQNGGALECVPEALRTEELCRVAVAQRGLALLYVPQHLRTEAMCKIAVKQHGRALQYVPERFRTDEMCKIAVTQNGLALGYVPKDLCTEDMCSIAVAQDGWALKDVPEKLCTVEICRIAVAQNGEALNYVPLQRRTEDICRLAVQQTRWAFDYVPGALRARIKPLVPAPVPIWEASLLDQFAEIFREEPCLAILEPHHA